MQWVDAITRHVKTEKAVLQWQTKFAETSTSSEPHCTPKCAKLFHCTEKCAMQMHGITKVHVRFHQNSQTKMFLCDFHPRNSMKLHWHTVDPITFCNANNEKWLLNDTLSLAKIETWKNENFHTTLALRNDILFVPSTKWPPWTESCSTFHPDVFHDIIFVAMQMAVCEWAVLWWSCLLSSLGVAAILTVRKLSLSRFIAGTWPMVRRCDQVQPPRMAFAMPLS